MRNATLLSLLSAAALLSTAAGAADLAKGKALHDSVCKTCHQSDYYTRKDRIIHSAEALKKQVHGCQVGAGEEWSAEQIEDVTAYLNDTYYKFK